MPIRQEAELDVLVRRRREGGRSTGSHGPWQGRRRVSDKILMPMLPSGKAFVAQAKKRWQLKSQLAKGYYGLEGWQKI